ncbi:MAG: hypothetical protein ACOC6P_01565 [Candidatus Aminicenantaceae bacterium]
MKNKRKFIITSAIFILCLVYFSSLPLGALKRNTSYWKIKVTAEKSKVRVERDLQSPVATIFPKGKMFKSYEKLDEWFRVVVTDELGFTIIGYIHSSEVEVLKEQKSSPTEFWEVESKPFKGINLNIKLTMGVNYFSGGTIGKGTKGIFDSTSVYISSFGYEETKKFNPLHSGHQLSGDIIYHFTPQLGIGVGAGYSFSFSKSTVSFTHNEIDGLFSYMDSRLDMDIIPLRLGLFLIFPLNKTFNLCLNAGPSVYIVNYSYTLNSKHPYYQTTLHKATSSGLGIQGGLGVDIKLNSRVFFFIEGQGRYAKITNLEGSIQQWVYSESFPLQNPQKNEGIFYYLSGELYPCLAVFKEGTPLEENAQKAVFDFSGFSLQTGIRLRF